MIHHLKQMAQKERLAYEVFEDIRPVSEPFFSPRRGNHRGSTVMGCIECGSSAGSQFQMCRPCIDQKKASRHYKFKSSNTTSESEIPLSSFEESAIQITGITSLSLVVFLYFFFFGSYSQDGPAAASMHAAVALCWSLSMLTWAMFWMRMRIVDTVWAVASIFVPAMVYRYVFVRWSETRVIFILHVIAVVLGLVLTFNLPEHHHSKIDEGYRSYEM